MTPVGPSPALVALIDEFLASHELSATSRSLKKELVKKNRIGTSTEKGTPPGSDVSLEEIFTQWLHDQKPKNEGTQMASSASEASSDSVSDTSDDSSSSDESQSESDSSSQLSSDSESESESDAEVKARTRPRSETRSITKTSSTRPVATSVRSKPLKRKYSTDSEPRVSDSSDSSSDEEPPAKKTKFATKAVVNGNHEESSSSSSSESSSDEESDSSSSEEEVNNTPVVAVSISKTKTIAKSPSIASDNSSGTIRDDSEARPASQLLDELKTAVEDSTDLANVHPDRLSGMSQQLKKHTGAKPTPLAQMSVNSQSQNFISNQYQSYEYAERAYKDLSVTRGKGFTKEKNKKKRGSYRGGAIDVGPGKGFKFED